MKPDQVKVLVVDDEGSVRSTLVDYLEDEGFQLWDVDSAEAGLELLARQEIHVGVVDIRLPAMDGASFIKASAKVQPQMRHLIYTGSVDFSIPETLAHLGFKRENLFNKPLRDMGILARAILGIMKEGKETCP